VPASAEIARRSVPAFGLHKDKSSRSITRDVAPESDIPCKRLAISDSSHGQFR
jgi:hypothetical protein